MNHLQQTMQNSRTRTKILHGMNKMMKTLHRKKKNKNKQKLNSGAAGLSDSALNIDK
jgi:hypothetical protein